MHVWRDPAPRTRSVGGAAIRSEKPNHKCTCGESSMSWKNERENSFQGPSFAYKEVQISVSLSSPVEEVFEIFPRQLVHGCEKRQEFLGSAPTAAIKPKFSDFWGILSSAPVFPFLPFITSIPDPTSQCSRSCHCTLDQNFHPWQPRHSRMEKTLQDRKCC